MGRRAGGLWGGAERGGLWDSGRIRYGICSAVGARVLVVVGVGVSRSPRDGPGFTSGSGLGLGLGLVSVRVPGREAEGWRVRWARQRV